MDKLTGDTEMLLGDGWRPMTTEGWQLSHAPKTSWLKKYSLHITVLLGFLIWSMPRYLRRAPEEQSRFEHIGENPYTMFDQKTAQACWSGPVSDPFAEYGGNSLETPEKSGSGGDSTSPRHLPLCKDLKK
jgi:hypothetical protein